VRELRNVVHRAYVMTEGDTIVPEVLEELLPELARPAPASRRGRKR
jgi:DNA-binding NtrC family response regulator